MPTSPTRYTPEYRQECAEYVISTGRSIVSVAEELGVNSKTLTRWVKLRKEQLSGGVQAQAESDELKEARRRIRELEMENEFLKKASAFFAASQLK